MSGQRWLAYGWGLGLVLLSVWPALREPPVDSYPLSTYPMFSERRGQPWVHRMLAIDRRGDSHPLPPQLIANGETLQAATTIRRAAHSGKPAMQKLCREVAARLHANAELAQSVRVEIRASRYDAIGYFTHSKFPIDSRRLHQCKVTP